MKIIKVIVILLLSAVSAMASDIVRPSVHEVVYFEGTDYELQVFEVYGRRDGNTMLIVGGIQGDEPGGYLSADLYAGLQLEQGNLIIIPRASLKSVITFNRGAEGDMNRLFATDTEGGTSANEKVVSVIMDYMNRADIFLNLHDGWGFHSSSYIDAQRNPDRFGQSIIIDTSTYSCDSGATIPLEAMAQDVLDVVNAKIDDKEHRLALFNTKTDDLETRFKDMKKTATWYALRSRCIPAFGIESSKNIRSLELRILYHNYAVNEFMRLMEIIPALPPIYVIEPVFENAVILVNNEPTMVKNGGEVIINQGDTVNVSYVNSNHDRGIYCDIVGYGNYNDISKNISINHSTEILFRKDNNTFAKVSLTVKPAPAVAIADNDIYLQLKLDGELKNYRNNDTIHVNSGAQLDILYAVSNGKPLDLPVNLKGWVKSSAPINDGDDRGGSFIVTASDFIRRYSLNNDGKNYPFVVTDSAGKTIFTAILSIN